VAARVFVFASIAWIALLAIVTGAATGSSLAALVFRFASHICHQQPDRTFHWDAAAWPVCARCLGLYAAAPAGALIGLLTPSFQMPRIGNFLLLCIAAMPTLATWIAEHALGWPFSNLARFIAALPLGAAVAWIVARTLQYTLPDARRG